jgi:hypothetical protein
MAKKGAARKTFAVVGGAAADAALAMPSLADLVAQGMIVDRGEGHGEGASSTGIGYRPKGGARSSHSSVGSELIPLPDGRSCLLCTTKDLEVRNS